MKKILVCGMSGNVGGVECFLMNYYRNINRNKVQFDFLSNSEHCIFEEEIKRLGGNVYHVCARSKNVYQFYKDMNEFFSNHAKDYNGIWVNKCMLNNIEFIRYAKRYNIPNRIIHAHNSNNMENTIKGKLQGMLHYLHRRSIHKYATDFWACSKDAGNWAFPKEIMKGEKFRIVHNAIDSEKYSYNVHTRELYRQRLGLTDSFVVGHVGRFQYQKNHEFLIDIFESIYHKNSNAVLLLIGVGELEDKIKQKVHNLRLDHAVKFLGVRNDVAQLMQAMDVFVFPSLFEGLGIALIEAQVAGLPSFTSANVVPQEAKITNLLQYINLNESAPVWADTIVDSQAIHRELYVQASVDYNIKSAASKLELHFSNICGK